MKTKRSFRIGALAASVALGFVGTVALASSASADPAPAVLAYGQGGAVWTSNVDGTSPHKIAVNANNPLPKVSPNGAKIAYDATNGSVFIADINGANPHQIATGPHQYVADWSPDSTQLLLVTPSGLQRVNAATFDHTAIPNTVDAKSAAAYWSPDGTLIAYSIGPGTIPPSASQVLIRPDGTGKVIRPLTVTGPWSPDGAHMVTADSDAISVFSVLTGQVTHQEFLSSDEVIVGLAWLPDASGYCQQVLHTAAPYAPTGFSGIECGQAAISGAYDPSVGGGIHPTDANGPPGQVTDLVATPSPSTVSLSWTPPASTPDFAGVEIRYALGSTAPATVTAGLDGGRLLTNATALKQLPPDQPVSVSVFSRDWFGNVSAPAVAHVTTPHQTLSTLTASASPFDLPYGKPSVVQGTLANNFWGVINPTPLQVSRRVWGTTGAFTPLGTTQGNGAGKFAFTQVPSISYEYQISYAGDANRSPASTVVRVRVGHTVAISVDHARAAAGTPVKITGTPRPALANGQTYLYGRNARGAAVRLGPHPTNSAGTVIFTVKAPAKGTSAAYRIDVPGSGGYIDGVSAWVTITGT